jgi:biotin---protein ligase
VNLRLKWPNDIYANGTTKIGGLMINTSIDSTKAILNVGCGVNLSNSTPTTCVNDLIRQHGAKLAELTDEQYFATIFNAIEKLFDRVQGGDFDTLYKLYYKYWLHG